MSPLPWPLMRRRDPYQGVTAPPVRLYERPAVRVVTGPPTIPPVVPLGPGTERAEHAHLHPWLAGEDETLARLAVETDRTDPWTAAVAVFTTPSKEIAK